MKKGIIVLTVILMITLTACGRNSHGDYSKIYESYGNIKNYTADIEVTVSAGENISDYKARQYYMAPDLYRVDYISEEMEDISCVLSGNTLKFKSPDGKVTDFDGYIPGEKYYIFITDFMERYCKSESAKSSASRGRTVLELEETGDNPQRAAMKLWINNKTGLPEKMITYNKDGEEAIVVKYSNFKMNKKMNKKIFEL